MTATLAQVVQDIDLLAPLPAAAAKLARVTRDWEADVHEVVTIIRYDQALTANILRYANSPMGGARYRIARVHDAVVRLGIPKVLEIAITAHIRSQMIQPLPQYGYDPDDLWRHSVAAAVAADVLVRTSPCKISPIAFTAALLHDVGKLVLARHLDPAVLKTISHLINAYGMTNHQAELEVLRFTHAAVGARVVDRWNLGEEIATAIHGHHDLDEERGAVSDAVRIANVAAKSIGCGLGSEGLNLEGDSGACQRVGVRREDFEALCAEVQTVLPEIVALYS